MSNIDKHAVQAVADLKAGYTLGHADVAILNELARIALASLEAEPVAWLLSGGGAKNNVSFDSGNAYADPLREVTPLYTAHPAPVSVPDEVCWEDVPEEITEDDMALASAWAHGFNQCRAAMIQGAEPVTTTYKSPDDFICMLTGRAKYLREKGEIKSPELLERAAAALQEESVNTTPIPNGWKLVPIDPTKDMLRAGQSVVGFWLNTVHCYSKMLAAAPAAPQQEVDNG
ncbi:hypothetical protein [Citrobacter braakii]|uniref:hypothetical protein n=1 Tax=Citrobacter braakii TaxID=57706 RepID=UPI0018D4F6CA|nr:hypothetical protein [Citrobacter braakii]